MDLRQLNALMAVVDHGSFSAAADALHTVQSNISSHVARLEKELGSVLVDRQTGGLTEEGQVVLRRARRIASEFDAVKADVAALRDEVVGDVRIGLIGTTARWIVPEVLEIMGNRYPHAHMQVSEATTGTLEPQLSSGQLDLAITLLPLSSPDIVTQPLFEEDMLLVVSSDHHMADREQVEMAELASIPMLLPPAASSARAEYDRAAHQAKINLTSKAEIDGVRLMASLVFDGHGPAILPATALPSYLTEAWQLISVVGFPRRRVGLANLRRSYPSAPVRALRDVLSEVVSMGAELHPGLHATAPITTGRNAPPSPKSR